MRTETFADRKVIDYLRENFIVVWNNHSPDNNRIGDQPKISRAQTAAYPEGGGRGNLRTLFVSPEGKLLFQLEGFWRTEKFLESAKFARGLDVKNARERIRVRLEGVQKERRRLAGARRLTKEWKEWAALGLLAEWHAFSLKMKTADVKLTLKRFRDEAMMMGEVD